MPSSLAPNALTASRLRLLAIVALGLGVAVLAVWFWSRFCRFPSIPWNDMRLAPSIALAQGWPAYPTSSDGTINTWMYGPLTLLFFWPASWASTAADALMVAAGLNAALTIVPLALVCFSWPVAAQRSGSFIGRLTVFLLCLGIWPELHYSVIFSDNLAIACGLLGNLVLVRAKSEREHWLAAIAVTAALACKQITLGMPLAQILWLGLTAGPRAAGAHTLRCAVAGLLIGAGAVARFGWTGLWFTLVEIPAGLGWAPSVIQRVGSAAPALLLHIVVPLVVIVIWRRTFRQPSLLLPTLAWICTLPLGIAGFMKVGGWTNSIHGFLLWLPPVLTTLFVSQQTERRLCALCAAAALAIVAIGSGRIITEVDFPLRPQIAAYRDAERFTAKSPRAIWFPVHPLITLYRDGFYYHDEDGLYVRLKAGKPATPAHLASHLPAGMHTMAFRNGWTDWGIARGMLPSGSRSTDLGHWTLWSGVADQRP
jgi:hypothetical protein